MTARSTYEAVAPVQNVALVAGFQAAEAAYTVTCDAAKAAFVAGGSFATYDAAVKAAQKTRVAAELLAAHNHQVAIQNARDVLKSTGDLAPS